MDVLEFKCKRCGGSLEKTDNAGVAKCIYCGTVQTVSKAVDEHRVNLYIRAEHLRKNNDFDKAIEVYGKILEEDPTDAEAYWSLVLCRYGIEYVEDPKEHKHLPTVNRIQYTSIFADEDYRSALKCADDCQKAIYEQEAHVIDEIQKGYLAIAQNEEPFDVFICYKETDANGRRTPDFVLARELYFELQKEGFKVFFSSITLEDKLGVEYEPYIFAALNSSKVMVVIGTRAEYLQSVWVKNEWSRYLALIKNGAKKMLIPAYRDMNPYDMPEEFSNLQAQDMSKLGFMQDLTRGIRKIIKADEPKPTVIKETKVVSDIAVPAASANIDPMLERAMIFIEDGEWESADEYCERALDIDPKNAKAYLIKLMIALQVHQESDLVNCSQPFDDDGNFKKAIRFGDKELIKRLNGYNDAIKERNFELNEQLEVARKNDIYKRANALLNAKNVSTNALNVLIESLEEAYKLFSEIPNWEDSAKKMEECSQKIAHLKEIAQEEYQIKLETEKRNRINKEIKKKKEQKLIIAIIAIIAATVAIALFLILVAYPGLNYLSGNYATYVNMYNVREFEVPNGVTSIGESAFENCDSLTNITIPDSVTSIGNSAFAYCDSLTSITIPDSVTSIGGFAFACCDSLASITIPNSVTSIGYDAFAYCDSLISITIPEGVTSIGVRAFSGCSSLTSITIPDIVTSIGDAAFSSCSNLETVYYTGTKEEWAKISIGSNNRYLTKATIIYNYVPEE